MTRKQAPDKPKEVVVCKAEDGKKFWMAKGEYTRVIVGRESTNSEYVISDGTIEPGGFVPDHLHKWEDQTFHVVTGKLHAKIGNEHYELGAGDTVHCPRGVSHYMKNVGTERASLISYFFPGDWAEDFMEETSRQTTSGVQDRQLIEERFGVVYIDDLQGES